MKKDLIIILESSLNSLGILDCPAIEIEIPKEEAFGDASTPLAMGLSRLLKKSPKKIAEDITKSIENKNLFKKIDIAGPGFINFTFTDEYLQSSLRKLLLSEKSFLREDIGKGKRVLVEFVSANPTGPLHIGHAKGAAVGNSLCNLLQELGFIVEREYYINDAGRQIRMLGLSIYAKYQRLVGKDCEFPEDGYRGQYIDEEASALYESSGDKYKDLLFESCERELTDWAYKRMLDLIKKDLALFAVRDFTELDK